MQLERFRQTFARIRSEVAERALRYGFVPPRIVIVTKYLPPEETQSLLQAGFQPLGENRAQDLVAKSPNERDASSEAEVRPWHFIGHLQRNKLASVLSRVSLVHSLDSRRLAQAIDAFLARTPSAGCCRDFLVQVNTSDEESKGGLTPEEAISEIPLWMKEYPHLRIQGLMTMAPPDAPDAARACFKLLRGIRDRLRDSLGSASVLRELSMGMSGDFEAAVEEGATWLRLGSILYE